MRGDTTWLHHRTRAVCEKPGSGASGHTKNQPFRARHRYFCCDANLDAQQVTLRLPANAGECAGLMFQPSLAPFIFQTGRNRRHADLGLLFR
jgi:hypothetical protein